MDVPLIEELMNSRFHSIRLLIFRYKALSDVVDIVCSRRLRVGILPLPQSIEMLPQGRRNLFVNVTERTPPVTVLEDYASLPPHKNLHQHHHESIVPPLARLRGG